VIAIAVQGGGPRRIDREDLVEPCDPEEPEHAPVRRNHRDASARTVERRWVRVSGCSPVESMKLQSLRSTITELHTVLGHGA
jgi:hypothetical protein